MVGQASMMDKINYLSAYSGNCAKSKRTCEYKETSFCAKSSSQESGTWLAKTKAFANEWQKVGSMCIPDALIKPLLQPGKYTVTDLCFVYQSVSNQCQLMNMGMSELTIIPSYLPMFVSYDKINYFLLLKHCT